MQLIKTYVIIRVNNKCYYFVFEAVVMFIKFDRKLRYMPRGATGRRIASAKSKFKREQEALPLFASQIAEEQQTPESYILSKDEAMLRFEKIERKRVADNWRRARKMLKNMPNDVRDAAVKKWNSYRWLPKTASYFCDMIFTHFREYYIEGYKKAA